MMALKGEKRIRLFSLILIGSLMACSARQTRPITPFAHYIPVNYEVTCAEGVDAPANLLPLIKKNIQEYLDDKSYWNKNARPVNMSIKITHIEEGSKPAYILIAFRAPTSSIAAEVVLSTKGEPIENFRINSKNRENPAMAKAVDLTDWMARQFVNKVMETVQGP